MLKSEPEVNRRQLGFEEPVLSNFDFLRSHGLKLVESAPTLVRFESREVFVNLYHGRASYEIGVEIGLKARSVWAGLHRFVDRRNGVEVRGLRHKRPVRGQPARWGPANCAQGR